MSSTQLSGIDNENDRISDLQDLIEANIKIDQQIESRSVGESVSSIEDILTQANNIVEGYENRITNPRELVLDTELLRRNHEVVGKAIQYSTNFTDKMFCDAIKNIVYTEQSEDWDALCSLACHIGVPFFTNTTMLPFIDVMPKEHVPKQRAARKPIQIVEEKRPKASDKLQRKGEGATAVNHVMKQIKTIYRTSNNQPIPYYKLVCNPDNFMDSVQNALIVSFLVKENLILIENGIDDLPQVRVNSNVNESSTHQNNQLILRLNARLCEKYVKHYNITQPMLTRINTD